MLADQAQALREMVAAEAAPVPQGAARIVAITSGKGGVGKSNVAVNLAIQLAQLGRRIVLLDADLGTANADVLCNLPPGQSLARVIAGQMSIDQALVDAPGGFKLIRGASGLAQVAALGKFERDRLMQQVQALEQQADLILIDTGAGVSPNVLGFAISADEMIVVTTPEPTAVTDAYAVIKTTRAQRQDIAVDVLLNMVSSAEEGRQVFHRLDAVCRRFLDLNIRYAGCLPLDPHVSAAVRQRRPFLLSAPGCPAAVGIKLLAQRLDRHVAEAPRVDWFRRAVAWLKP
jgi:flagellar biosynthesis protein FlhG